MNAADDDESVLSLTIDGRTVVTAGTDVVAAGGTGGCRLAVTVSTFGLLPSPFFFSRETCSDNNCFTPAKVAVRSNEKVKSLRQLSYLTHSFAIQGG